jgi:plasmid stability protein
MVGVHPSWSQIGTTTVNLSIKNAPDDVVQRLRARAERHHRSLQGELLAIIEAAVQEDRSATPAEILAEVRRLGIRTPSEAAALVRARARPVMASGAGPAGSCGRAGWTA